MIELNLQQHNLGLNSAWKRAQERFKWRQLVETAVSSEARDDDDDEHLVLLLLPLLATKLQTLTMLLKYKLLVKYHGIELIKNNF